MAVDQIQRARLAMQRGQKVQQHEMLQHIAEIAGVKGVTVIHLQRQGQTVTTMGPLLVITSVCSYCAVKIPASVARVQPSSISSAKSAPVDRNGSMVDRKSTRLNSSH